MNTLLKIAEDYTVDIDVQIRNGIVIVIFSNDNETIAVRDNCSQSNLEATAKKMFDEKQKINSTLLKDLEDLKINDKNKYQPDLTKPYFPLEKDPLYIEIKEELEYDPDEVNYQYIALLAFNNPERNYVKKYIKYTILKDCEQTDFNTKLKKLCEWYYNKEINNNTHS